MSNNNAADTTRTARPNDVTILYGVWGDLGRLAKEIQDEIGEGVGAKVSGDGTEFKGVDGWFTGERATVSHTFTLDADVPAWKFEDALNRLRNFATRDVELDVRISGSVRGYQPRVKPSGAVIPRGPDASKIDPDNVRHKAVIEATVDVTRWMVGPEQ